MANGEASYPKIPDVSWWKLRDLFKQKVPVTISASYVSSALGMTEASAKANILGPFKKIGLIDDAQKPTAAAFDWRDDDKYPLVCAAILESQYPQEIRDLFHSPDSDIQKITKWFMSDTKSGMDAAKKYARFYLLMVKGDVVESSHKSARKVSVTAPAKKAPPLKAAKHVENNASPTTPPSRESALAPTSANEHFKKTSGPELHINIQLHISPESTAEQIDKIFESMAKHLKNLQG
jgi:hypothetical protein